MVALEKSFEEKHFGPHAVLSPDGPGELVLVKSARRIP